MEAIVSKALETSSEEQKREEDSGSYFCLHLYFSTAGEVHLHLPLLVSSFLR